MHANRSYQKGHKDYHLEKGAETLHDYFANIVHELIDKILDANHQFESYVSADTSELLCTYISLYRPITRTYLTIRL